MGVFDWTVRQGRAETVSTPQQAPGVGEHVAGAIEVFEVWRRPMPKVRGCRVGLLSVFIAAVLCVGRGPLFAQPADFDPAIEVLRDLAKPPATPGTKDSAAVGSSRLELVYPTTIVPGPTLLLRLQALFATYFDAQINLTPLLAKLVRESAVAALPGQGQILYNPAHMLILHLPEGWENGSDIRVAALEDLSKILKQQRPDNPLLAAYGKGFEEFALLSNLMKDPDARETLELIWTTSPRSKDDKERMRYLLLRPIEQAAAIRNERPACRQVIDRFVDDVRAGKRASIPVKQGLSDIVKPTRFIRHENQILLLLSEVLIARYYVISQFSVDPEGCSVTWEKPIFAL
jgi:hypothetical protein